MEKVVVLLECDGTEAPADLLTDLTGRVAPELRYLGASGIQVNVVDPSLGHPHGIAPSWEAMRIVSMISYWVAAAGEHGIHTDVLPRFDGCRTHEYLVNEAVQLCGPPPPTDGSRCTGFTQIVPLSVPAGMSWAEWRRRWQGSHTDVAIETQSSFRYVQNVVLRPLGSDARAFAAVVEESFPSAAASDATVFYDAVDDPKRFETNTKRMMESCATFLDAVVPIAWTAEYRLPD